MASHNIVVLGYVYPINAAATNESEHQLTLLRAGVSGLTTAYLLSKNAFNQITVAAKHMPGDYDIEYCSPWACADGRGNPDRHLNPAP